MKVKIVDRLGKRHPGRFEIRREGERIANLLRRSPIIRGAEVWIDHRGVRAFLRPNASTAEKEEWHLLTGDDVHIKPNPAKGQ